MCIEKKLESRLDMNRCLLAVRGMLINIYCIVFFMHTHIGCTRVCRAAISQTQPRFCHTVRNTVSGTGSQDFKLLINKFPPMCGLGPSLLRETLQAAGGGRFHGLEELADEEEEAPASIWTSSVLKKRRKKMNKHKYKKRKRRDRYKTKKK